MENLTFSVLALLPLALASLLHRERKGVYAGFGFLAALAPVVASGLSSLFKHKQAKSAEKKQAEYDKQQALATEAANRTAFESSQNSPQALAQRQKFTIQLGKLLGKAGGKEKIPPSIYNYLSQGRQAQAYTPGAAYTPKPTSGAGIWDFASGLGDALSYFDYSKLKKPTGSGGELSGFGRGSSFTPQTQVRTALAAQDPAASRLAVTGITRQPWDQTHLQYSGGVPTVYSPTSLPAYMPGRR